MARVVIIGGGFAGVWSAAGAALARGDADLHVTLVAPNEHMVLRPRLYEPEPDLAKVELSRILGPIGVEHVPATVSTIDTGRRMVVADGEEIGYDRLVLAAGSKLVRPDGLPGAERLFDIDTLDGARRLTDHLRDREDYSAVVVGAGFVGLEAATALVDRGRVLLVDRSPVVGHQLGPSPRAEIESALDELGIERRLGTTVAEVGDGYAVLTDGSRVEADAVVWSVGMRASELTRQVTGDLDHLGRVPVDRHLRALPDVFVAGDTAAAAFDADHTVMQACQHATPLGKVAGYNAAADLLGVPPRDFTPGPYVTCLDLGGAGGIFTRGWDRRVMASGADGAEIKRRINQAIHPPVDDAAAILAAADRVRIELPFFPRSEEVSAA
ncbi:FAD-dependent oxidoreductase [Pseudonocardia sp. DSM 110487]|uniref:NAD(P)/FAD-dependent oxidoreductase n=1 Tax=Pseudonocardia sp. DSM 110487 TaxID=2865833 RepID=UPI001C6A3206|nr:FAD-dependent oxidoreductase [Pseudonocardia sp. DSM 110487]QYN39702.1 FAD-dependent oxidoreductase [Pseudonocardia sp. DSM 110487]